jgi:uncharacterized membrane protein YebE (DUF533 family)
VKKQVRKMTAKRGLVAPKAKKNKTSPRKPQAAQAAPPAAGALPASAQERFVSDLLVRGEAAEASADGTLPLNATHEITGRKEDGSAEVKRVRVKLF